MKKQDNIRRKENTARKNAEKKQRAAVKQDIKVRKNALKIKRMKELAAEKAERKRERALVREAKNKLAEERYKRRRAFYGKIKAKLKNNSDGFDYDNFGIMPRVELIVNGDRTSLAMRLSQKGISTLDVTGTGGVSRVKLRKKDMRKAIAILDEMCYTYKVGATYGMGRRLKFCLARCGLIIGAVAAVVCLNISYGYIWRIDIEGNDKLSAAAVESVLKSANIRVGRKKSSLDFGKIAAALECMDGVADASCDIVGTTLRVHILESKDYTVREKYRAYLAEYDATVTRIVMRNGNALVKRGDIVKSGDVLANGDVYSTTGELMYKGECDGEIYGDVSITYSADVSVSAVEYKRTGRVTTCTVFGLFGHDIGRAKSPYAAYETTVHTASYDVLIPLYVTTYKFYETKPVDVERDINDVAESFAAQKIEEMHFAGDFKYSYNTSATAGGLYSIHLFLSGEAVISRGAAEVPQETA